MTTNANGALQKRSILLRDHRTSTSLEPAFWGELERMAREAKLPLIKIIEGVNDNRKVSNLAGALRLAVVEDLRAKAFPKVTA